VNNTTQMAYLTRGGKGKMVDRTLLQETYEEKITGHVYHFFSRRLS
jgi:hypothetical protein